MGITAHELNLLIYASRKRRLGNVLTIGRQWLLVDPCDARSALGKMIVPSTYCENSLLAAGASTVESIDSSSYEEPTYVADLGRPYRHPTQYDTVMDFGSLEHIFDIRTALDNISRMTKCDGMILHSSPVNNLSGHGFFQFSSDLFYQFYSKANGFAYAQVFYASSIDATSWFEIPAPIIGKRFEVTSLEPLIAMCVAIKEFGSHQFCPAAALLFGRMAGRGGQRSEKSGGAR